MGEIRLKAFITGLIAVLAVIVAIAVLGVVYSHSSVDLRDQTIYSSLAVSRLSSRGLFFLEKTFQDASLDASRTKACLSSSSFCDAVNSRALQYSFSSIAFLNETPFYNKLSDYSYSCIDNTASASPVYSYSVSFKGNYSLWAGNSSFALASKRTSFNWVWNLNLSKSPPYAAILSNSTSVIVTVPFAC